MSYIPAVADLPFTEDPSDDGTIHLDTFPIYLPSSLPSHLAVAPNLVIKETKLRIAQANDALAELRHLLRILRDLWDYKYTQLGPSQRAKTRAQSFIGRFKDKINLCVERYHTAWRALTILDPEGSWTQTLLELKQEDVKILGPGDGESEGRREVSWIWITRLEKDETSEEEMCEGKLKLKTM